MPVESCTQSLCDLALRFGEDGEGDAMVREGLGEASMGVQSAESPSTPGPLHNS